MKLKYAKIMNFRSIQDVRIDFNPSCRILVGINESGKSNILKALSMIGEELLPTPEDIREPLPQEKSIEESYIRFVFELEKNEIENIYKRLEGKLLAIKAKSSLLKKSQKEELSLLDFCYLRKEGVYDVNVIKQNKYGTYWALNNVENEYIVLDHWKKPSASCPVDYTVHVEGGEKLLKHYNLINTKDYTKIPETYLEDIDEAYINDLIGNEVKGCIVQSLPKVIFWKYDEKNLLPPLIDINEFASNPDICVPLKNMFMLAGIKNIGVEINQAQQISANKLRNLLRRVATHTTNHFRNVWKEYKEIKFALEPNATNIEANIVEKNYWRMTQRSDGFKRFIAFLLHISANVKSNILSNVIILVDEPDTSLHPSGTKYLRDELIETAKKNYVVFSTHSIFMIDKNDISRHIIVKKEQEKTSVTNTTNSNFVDEEVLFNALNFTVFDILQKDNIIFEGWRDKKLFQIAWEKVPNTHVLELKALGKRLKNIGLCHAEGVKDIRNVTPLLELANRNCLIISDSDKPAKEKQKEFQMINGYGVWQRYDEISKNNKAETGEDFIKLDVFMRHLKKILQKNPNITGKPVLNSTGRMTEIKKWLLSQNVNQALTKEFLEEIKHSIFDELKPADIDDSYYNFLKDLSPLVESLLPKK